MRRWPRSTSGSSTVSPSRWTRSRSTGRRGTGASPPSWWRSSPSRAGARLHREHVVDALWPDLSVDRALPRLHKAAHFARRALSSAPGLLEVRQDSVALAGGHRLRIDVADFEAAAQRVLQATPPDPGACAALVRDRPAVLLPDVLEEWVDERRARQRGLVLELLIAAGLWAAALRLDPVNERAHVGLVRAALQRRDRGGGLRAYADMERVLAEELAVDPPREAEALREALLALDERTDGLGATSGRRTHALLERDHELAVLDECVAAAVRGRGGVVLVSGDAGVGKSALVEALLDTVTHRSAEVTVLRGSCDDLVAPRSLGPFEDMAAEGDGELRGLLGTAAMPDVLPALLALLGRGPTVAVIEDLHWADDATLDAMRYLARRVGAAPLVLVATFRSHGLAPDHPLTQLLGQLLGGHVMRLALEPLSVAAVRELSGYPEAEAAEVHRITGGNPFFDTEAVAAGAGTVPTTVRDAVLGRIAGLAPPARALLRRLSVVPGRCEPWLADALATGPEALVEAEVSGVLVGEADGVAFRHELARRAVESSLPTTERVAAHRDVLDVLWAVPGVPTSRLVHHAALGRRYAEPAEIGPAAAADAARQGAHRQCAEILRVVLEGSPQLPADTAAALWLQRSYSSYVVNRFDAAYAGAEEAVRLADRTGDRSVLMDALPVLARAAMFARGPEAARAAAQRAVDLSRRETDPVRLAAALTELARAHSNLPSVSVVAQPSPTSEAAAVEALAIATDPSAARTWPRARCATWARPWWPGATWRAWRTSTAPWSSPPTTPGSRPRCAAWSTPRAAFRLGRLPDVERLVATGLVLADECEFFAGQYRLRLTRAAARASGGSWTRPRRARAAAGGARRARGHGAAGPQHPGPAARPPGGPPGRRGPGRCVGRPAADAERVRRRRPAGGRGRAGLARRLALRRRPGDGRDPAPGDRQRVRGGGLRAHGVPAPGRRTGARPGRPAGTVGADAGRPGERGRRGLGAGRRALRARRRRGHLRRPRPRRRGAGDAGRAGAVATIPAVG